MTSDLVRTLRPALVLTAVMFGLTGLAYPLAITGIAQALMPDQANGSLVVRDGRVIGSRLIAQGFSGDRWFHPRPSAAGKGYDPTQSGGSNLAPTARTLIDRVSADHRADPAAPPDMLTTSASGLDPDISPEAAAAQVARVAAARHIDAASLHALVAAHVVAPIAGLIGEPHVNVLALNLALDSMPPKGPHIAR